MKWMLAGAALAAFTVVFGGAASASMCSNDCDHSYGVCNGLNGAAGQQVCMPKWMQCKRACSSAAKPTAVKISTAPAKPRP